MITYVDTSSLLKLVVDEEGSERVEEIWNASPVVASVTLVVVEGRAALAAAERGSRLSDPQHLEAKQRLGSLVDDLSMVEVTEQLISGAADLAEEESLRGYDAVHLAAGLLVGADILTSADWALCDAAERRGLHVANPLDV